MQIFNPKGGQGMKSQRKLGRIPAPLTDEERVVLEKIRRRDFVIDSIIAALAMIAAGVIAICVGWVLL